MNIHKKGMFSKMTLDEMLCHTTKLLPAPLLNVVRKQDEPKATQAFRNVTAYMGDRKSSKESMGHVEKISKFAIQGDHNLQDEIYMQVVKQTTGNDNRDSLIKGWQLMAVLAGVSPCSQAFHEYLVTYMQKTADKTSDHVIKELALFCEERLSVTQIQGARKLCPTPMEVQAVEKMRPVPLRIEFVDSTFKTLGKHDT